MKAARAMLWLLACWAHAETHDSPITVVLRNSGSASAKTIAALKDELRTIMRDSGVQLDFHEGNVRPGETFRELIVVKLTGRCEMDLSPVTFDERGPEGLAFTHSSDGNLLPFTVAPCDRVRAAIRTVMWGEDYRRGDYLLGRALGRVISHEFYHILAKTRSHGRSGIAQHSLSAYQLISDRLRLDRSDANLIRIRSLAVSVPQTDLP